MASNIAADILPASRPVTATGWTALQIKVVALCAIINMLDGMDVLVISFVAPALTNEWGVSFQALGLIFSAGLAGMMIGCLLIAPLADVFGRRPVVIAGLAVMTLGMIGSGLASGVMSLGLCRGIAGIGIGTLLASIAALASEYAPPGRRTVAVGIFQAGYPLGAVLTGFVTIWALPLVGWQAVLIGAGLCSAALLPIVVLMMPESLGFLERRQPAGALARINALRTRMAMPLLAELPPTSADDGKVKLSRLFADGMWRPTLTLWMATLLSFTVLYFVTSWIPKLSIEAGLAENQALYAGAIFNLGGLVGATSIGVLAARLPIGRLICAFLIAASALMMVFSLPMPLAAALITAMLIGMTLQGGFSGFYSLAALLYPAEVRSSGIGWAMGVGRGGSILGPIVGGFLLEQHYPLWIVFLCFAVPLAVAGVLASLIAVARARA